MIRLITHALVFIVGAGVGVYWGVNHPTQAQNIANTEQSRLDQLRQQTQKVVNQTPPTVTPAAP